MKNKLQSLSTRILKNIFDQLIETTHLSNEILDLLPERKQRSFIIEKLLYEYNESSLKDKLQNWF